MKAEIINPFITGGYLSPGYFCNRTGETHRITDAISSSRSLTLISFGRMGKTGLLKHVKYQLEIQKIHQINTDFEPQYINYRNLLPPHQFRLPMAIAAEDGVKQPTSGNFIGHNDLTSPSSVSTSLRCCRNFHSFRFLRADREYLLS